MTAFLRLIFFNVKAIAQIDISKSEETVGSAEANLVGFLKAEGEKQLKPLAEADGNGQWIKGNDGAKS